jgi:hypothetical protein
LPSQRLQHRQLLRWYIQRNELPPLGYNGKTLRIECHHFAWGAKNWSKGCTVICSHHDTTFDTLSFVLLVCNRYPSHFWFGVECL